MQHCEMLLYNLVVFLQGKPSSQCLYGCIKTRSAAPSHGDVVALSCVPSHAIVTSRPALVQVPAKVRVVSTRSSSNSRRQCYWSQHHHITGMKLLLLGQWLTRPIGDIPHTILPSGAQGCLFLQLGGEDVKCDRQQNLTRHSLTSRIA